MDSVRGVGKAWLVTNMANNEVTSAHVAVLQRRVATLEKRIVGDEEVRKGQNSITSILNSVEKRMRTLGSKHEAVPRVWESLPELEKLLSPEYVKALMLTEEGKEELLLCGVEQLEEVQDRVEELQSLKDCTNSSTFRGLEQHEKKLSTIAAGHVRQEAEVKTLTKDISSFVHLYTSMLLQMSAKCVEWEETVSQLEQAQS